MWQCSRCNSNLSAILSLNMSWLQFKYIHSLPPGPLLLDLAPSRPWAGHLICQSVDGHYEIAKASHVSHKDFTLRELLTKSWTQITRRLYTFDNTWIFSFDSLSEGPKTELLVTDTFWQPINWCKFCHKHPCKIAKLFLLFLPSSQCTRNTCI